jgi:DNA-binding NtrC family response regulator
MLLLAPEDVVEANTVTRALPNFDQGTAGNFSRPLEFMAGALGQRVEAFERETLLAELKRNHNHMTNTAKALGLERSHLYKKCQQLGIDLRAIRSET